jgi:predicted nucleic acid-binding protein
VAPSIEERVLGTGETLHAPHVLDVEVAQVLRRYASRGEVSPARPRRAIELLALFPMTRYSHEPLLPRIWALRAKLTAFDAAYVALAEGLAATLLTRDEKLAKAPVARAATELM